METENSLGKLIDVGAVAAAFGMRRAQIYSMAAEGRLPCVRFGRVLRFDPATLREFVANGGAKLPGGWRREAR